MQEAELPTEGLISIIDDDEDFREAIVLSENFIRSGIGLLRSNRRIITSDGPLGFRQLRR